MRRRTGFIAGLQNQIQICDKCPISAVKLKIYSGDCPLISPGRVSTGAADGNYRKVLGMYLIMQRDLVC